MKVVVLPPVSRTAPADLAERLPGWVVELVADKADAAAALVSADAVIAMILRPETVAGAKRLRLCQGFVAGIDLVAVDALPPGCTVCNAYDHEVAIGEHVLGVTLMLTRRLGLRDRDLRAGRFSQGEGFDGDLRGRTVGVIGLGHIGRRVVEVCRAIGMRAVAVTASPSAERAAAGGLEWLGGPGRDDLHELLRRADVAVVCLPLEQATEGLIGAEELAALGPAGILVNVARGPVVQERPLYEALRDGRVAGAAIDVWWQYPSGGAVEFRPSSEPFWELDNVVLTPHSAGSSESMVHGRWELCIRQLQAFAEGRPLENVIARAAPDA
jgi:phosphoglycerate dehydrogenase-like enzyme